MLEDEIRGKLYDELCVAREKIKELELNSTDRDATLEEAARSLERAAAWVRKLKTS